MALNNNTLASPVFWSSRLMFILVASGAAVGLGNIWRFPYMTGINGGGAFVLLYLAAIICIGVPLFMGEVLLGRSARRNPADSLQNLATTHQHSRHWQHVGWLGGLTTVFIFAVYSVIAGWVIAYLFYGWQGVFTGDSVSEIDVFFDVFVASPWIPLLAQTAFIAATFFIVLGGIKKGLERAAGILMPCFFILMISLLVYVFFVGDVASSVRFLLTPDFSALTGHSIIEAMTHAFYTLSIGMGLMLVYGAYLADKVRIGQTVFIIATIDTLVALLAGIIVFSIVFAHGLAPSEGPGLIFVTVPTAFSQLAGGHFFVGLFFLFLFVAALTSSVALAEAPMMLLRERFHLSRKKSALLLSLVVWVLGLGVILSFNAWSDLKLFGEWTFFASLDGLSTTILLPLCALLFTVFVGWIMPQTAAKSLLKFNNDKTYLLWHIAIRYVVPLAIVLVMVAGLLK